MNASPIVKVEVVDLTTDDPPLRQGPLSKASPRHIWTTQERIALRVLVESYDDGWNSVVPVFNAHFQTAEYNWHGLSERILKGQHDWMRCRKSVYHTKDISKMVEASLLSPESAESVKSSLEATASRLGMRLVRKGSEAVPKQLRQELPVISYREATILDVLVSATAPAPTATTPTTPSDRVDTGLETPPRSERLSNRYLHLPSYPPKSPIGGSFSKERLLFSSISNKDRSTTQASVSSSELPKLVFRGYTCKSQGLNSVNGFRAGVFVNKQHVTPAPSTNSQAFRSDLIRHISADKSGPTSFISTTKNPIRAIMRASRHQDSGFLSIIDLTRANEVGSIYVAGSLDVKSTGVHYDAKGEYLAWGELKKNVIISTIPVTALMKAHPSIPGNPDPFQLEVICKSWRAWFPRSEIYKNRLQLTFMAGSAVGQLIRTLGLPRVYLETGVTTIIEDWNFSKPKHKKWQDNKAFCDGVTFGYRGNEVMPTLPDNIVSIADDDYFANFVQDMEEAAIANSSDDTGDIAIEISYDDLGNSDNTETCKTQNDSDHASRVNLITTSTPTAGPGREGTLTDQSQDSKHEEATLLAYDPPPAFHLADDVDEEQEGWMKMGDIHSIVRRQCNDYMELEYGDSTMVDTNWTGM